MKYRTTFQFFNTKIIYITPHIARKCIAVVPGRDTWCLLNDGSIGTSDTDVFKWAYPKGSQKEYYIAEKLWRLGKIKKQEFKKIEERFTKKKHKEHLEYIAANIKSYAGELKLKFTKEQEKLLGIN